MILLGVVVLAVLVGLLAGGKLTNLGLLAIRHGELALGAFLLQALLVNGSWLDTETTRSVAVGLMILSYLPAFVFVGLNKRFVGLVIVGLGLLLNLTVIALNGGYMPASPETLTRMGYDVTDPALSAGNRVPGTKDMMISRQATRLWVLSDRFVTPRELPWRAAFSIGDVILSIGALVFILNGMRFQPERKALTLA